MLTNPVRKNVFGGYGIPDFLGIALGSLTKPRIIRLSPRRRTADPELEEEIRNARFSRPKPRVKPKVRPKHLSRAEKAHLKAMAGRNANIQRIQLSKR